MDPENDALQIGISSELGVIFIHVKLQAFVFDSFCAKKNLISATESQFTFCAANLLASNNFGRLFGGVVTI